jgi:hypothetical protein
MTSPFVTEPTLVDDTKTYNRLKLNLERNRKQDHTALLDEAAGAFDYAKCRDSYWNPEAFSLCYGTPIWEQSSPAQRVILNQLYWVAYYSQIISAEIATIFFNQTSAAGLYALEDFRIVCDTLDLESMQERAHINAFKKISDETEHALFGKRIFSYAMRGPYDETMVHGDTDRLRAEWKRLQLRTFGMLSSGNAFIACQYFTVRGLRTLNGKIVQHQLSHFYAKHPDQANAPVPSAVSYYHFQDESYHFNSSMLISKDVLGSLKAPTPFERMVANMALRGCQKDHFHFSAAINGIFWYDPSVYAAVLEVLTSKHFGLDRRGALELMERSFCHETDGAVASRDTHTTARESYKRYLDDSLGYVSRANREMAVMSKSTLEGHLAANRAAMRKFAATAAAA